jgi:sterol desaturase/sphingolipid hydroxylase (fatty acid hydroxylase superfamily)
MGNRSVLGNVMAPLGLRERCSPVDPIRDHRHQDFETDLVMYTILIIILILLLLGALPNWPYSTGWGYYPSGGLGLVILVLFILLLLGRI